MKESKITEIKIPFFLRLYWLLITHHIRALFLFLVFRVPTQRSHYFLLKLTNMAQLDSNFVNSFDLISIIQRILDRASHLENEDVDGPKKIAREFQLRVTELKGSCAKLPMIKFTLDELKQNIERSKRKLSSLVEVEARAESIKKRIATVYRKKNDNVS